MLSVFNFLARTSYFMRRNISPRSLSGDHTHLVSRMIQGCMLTDGLPFDPIKSAYGSNDLQQEVSDFVF